jgi:hypothetical protein
MRNLRIAVVLLALAGCSPAPEPSPGDVPPAEERPTRVLLLEEYPRWEYRFLKNALIRDASLQVDALLLSATPGYTPEGSPGRTPLMFIPGSREELAKYDVIIIGDVSLLNLNTPELDSQQVCRNLAAWVEEDGGGLILIAGERSMPKLWKATALEPLFPVEIETPLPEANENYRYRLIEDPVTSFPVEAWENREDAAGGLRGISWILASRCKPGALTLVESGPENRRVPLFVTRECGRGRVFFSATDETWKWRFACGDEPWFHPFWSRVIHWARFGE